MKGIKSWLAVFSLCLTLGACAQDKTTQKPTQSNSNEMSAEKKRAISSIKVAKDEKDYNTLSEKDYEIIENKSTERAFTGAYHDHKGDGIYKCKRCNSPLFTSDAKFDSRSGWPSFDDAIEGSIKEITDADGRRTEILCSNCNGHLGHVFKGEGFTNKNTRHCVNSASLIFLPWDNLLKKAEE